MNVLLMNALLMLAGGVFGGIILLAICFILKWRLHKTKEKKEVNSKFFVKDTPRLEPHWFEEKHEFEEKHKKKKHKKHKKPKKR